jgi:hypothetical protein
MFEEKKIYFTTPVMEANITWLQNMNSLVSQLYCRVASGDAVVIRALDDYVKLFVRASIGDHFY